MPACPHGALGRPHSVTAAGSRSLPAGGGLILDARILAWGAGAQDRPGAHLIAQVLGSAGLRLGGCPHFLFIYLLFTPLLDFICMCVCCIVQSYIP